MKRSFKPFPGIAVPFATAYAVPLAAQRLMA